MLRFMTYNIQFGGVDDDGTRVDGRLPLIHEVVRQARPDVLAVQDANGFDERDFRRLFAFERAVGMRSIFVQFSYGFHGLILLRPEFAPVSMRNDYPLGNRLLMGLVLRTPGGAEMTVHNVHLDTNAPQQRVDGILRRLSEPTSLVMGDFNNLRPDDPGAEQVWQALLPAYRTRVSGGSGERADGRVFQAVEQAGHVDLFRHLHPHDRGATLRGAEGLRIDYVFATADLATRVTRCEVFDTAPAREASDHFPVVADFDLD
jgi:exodeoxyribonuclease-3